MATQHEKIKRIKSRLEYLHRANELKIPIKGQSIPLSIQNRKKEIEEKTALLHSLEGVKETTTKNSSNASRGKRGSTKNPR
jgi:hypothetical protein